MGIVISRAIAKPVDLSEAHGIKVPLLEGSESMVTIPPATDSTSRTKTPHRQG
jgi:hypothetical protein